MGLEKALSGLLAVEFLFVVVAFGVGIALTAKDHYWQRNVSSVDPSMAGYVATPSLLTYNIFIGAFSTVTLLILNLVWHFNHLLDSVFLGAQFIYLILYLGGFVQFATSDLTHIDCTVFSGTGDLYKSFCALPKACEALDGICWILALIALGLRWATIDSSSEQPDSTETELTPQKPDA